MNKEVIIEKIIQERGGLANIHRSYEDFPIGMEAHYDFYSKTMIAEEGLPLNREQREWLAVETSKANECPYCINHHQAALDNFQTDLPIEQKEVFTKLARTLTLEPWKANLIQKEFLGLGLSKSQWQHAVMVVAYFNMANRIAFGMDLQLEDNFKSSCN